MCVSVNGVINSSQKLRFGGRVRLGVSRPHCDMAFDGGESADVMPLTGGAVRRRPASWRSAVAAVVLVGTLAVAAVATQSRGSAHAARTAALDARHTGAGGTGAARPGGSAATKGRMGTATSSESIDLPNQVVRAEVEDLTPAQTANILKNKQSKRDRSGSTETVTFSDPYPDPVTNLWGGDDADDDGKASTTTQASAEEAAGSSVTWATFGNPSPTPSPSAEAKETTAESITEWIRMGAQVRGCRRLPFCVR